jgi:hypothetical protein
VLTEAFRRGVLKLFVEKDLFDPETAAGMPAWQHSGFSVHDGVWLDPDDAAAHERLARYCARCPVSLERLEYDAETGTVTYTSDKAEGPTAGRHSFEAAEFIALLVAHIPDKGQVKQRYYGDYANRTRGERRKAGEAAATAGSDGGEPTANPDLPEGGVSLVEPEDFSRGDARRRWAELHPTRLRRAGTPTAHPPGLRGGPADLPALRRRDAGDRADPGAGGDRPDPAAPAREGPGCAGRALGDGAAGGWGGHRGGVRAEAA